MNYCCSYRHFLYIGSVPARTGRTHGYRYHSSEGIRTQSKKLLGVIEESLASTYR